MTTCEFRSIADLFNFGKYNGLSLADVLDLEPSYLEWCMKSCTIVNILLYDKAVEEVRIVYPDFKMDSDFELHRNERIERYELFQI